MSVVTWRCGLAGLVTPDLAGGWLVVDLVRCLRCASLVGLGGLGVGGVGHGGLRGLVDVTLVYEAGLSAAGRRGPE